MEKGWSKDVFRSKDVSWSKYISWSKDINVSLTKDLSMIYHFCGKVYELLLLENSDNTGSFKSYILPSSLLERFLLQDES